MILPENNLTQVPSAVRPVLISSLAHCLLQGIIFCQMVSFYQRQAADSLRLKVFVYILFILCLAQTVHQIYKVWVVTVSEENWANSPARYVEFPLNSVICSSVQAFLVRRVWKVTGKRWTVLVPLVLLLLTTFSAGLTMSVTINSFIQNPLVNVTNCHGLRCIPEFSTWLWGSAILDATITVALSVYFVKSKTGFHYLDAVVTKIWNLTLITAALPMASMLAAVSLFYATGGLHYHIVTALTIISSKLYFNGLLRNLNVRDKLKASMQANTLGRRSIITVGSFTSPNVRRVSSLTDDTLADDLSTGDDGEKAAAGDDTGCVNQDRALTEPSVASLRRGKPELDIERGESRTNLSLRTHSDGQGGRLSHGRPGWPLGRINGVGRIVTL